MHRKKILILGSSGQLGTTISELPWQFIDLDAVLANRNPNSDEEFIDMTDSRSIGNLIDKIQPQYIINCAAYTQVDRAEEEATKCQKINADAVGQIAASAEKLGAGLIHFSSDYVYNVNHSNPISESAQVNPTNQYGYSKAVGDSLIKLNTDRYIIFRTSWVFSKFKNNFIKSMLELLSREPEIKIVNDQRGALTSCKLLAEATLEAIGKWQSETYLSGIYHLSNTGYGSWYDIASYLKKRIETQRSLKNERLIPIPSIQYPTKAKRPKNSMLECTKFDQDFTIPRKSWQNEIDLLLGEI